MIDAPLREELVALRRELHAQPELSWEEVETSAFLKKRLAAVGQIVPLAKTGFYIDLGRPDATKTLLLRADMDALPILEETGLPYASKREGVMHACGHDAHMAALTIAAEILAEKDLGPLRVRLLFQPCEEGGEGARACIEAGVLEGVDAAFGIHVWNDLPIGTVAVTPHGIMAGVVELGFEVRGVGGHGALPHRSVDPVVAASQLVLALQTIASRGVAPVDPVVVTIGSIHGGEAFNVIPDSVKMVGTIRAFSEEVLGDVEQQVRRITAGIAAATGTEITVSWRLSTRPTVNAPEMAERARQAALTTGAFEAVRSDYRTMAGEDFGEILREIPGCYALVGSANAAKGLTEPHHSPRFEIDEDALAHALALHLSVVESFRESVAAGS